jgi:hypothetical protein
MFDHLVSDLFKLALLVVVTAFALGIAIGAVLF